MKVALVVPENKLYFSSACAPLNLGHLASYLRKYGKDVDVRIIDAMAGQNVTEELFKFQPDIVGATATTPQAPAAYALLDSIRRNRPDIYTVIGGMHPSVMPKEAAEHADTVVIGEGEKALLNIYNSLQSGIKPPQIIQGEFIEDLDTIPSPAWDLIDCGFYLKKPLHPTMIVPCLSLVTSRGCPFKCRFCYNSSRVAKTRYFSAQRIIDDITYFYNRFGIRSIVFNDDEFVINKKRLNDLAVLMEQTGLNKKIVWGCQARVNSLDLSTLRLMRKMGCVFISSGFESCNPRILKYLKCGSVTVKQNERPIPLAHQAGIAMGGSFIFGTPTETLEEMKRSLRWFEDQDALKFMGFNTLVPFPGTPVWELCKAKGYLPKTVDYTKLVPPTFPDNTYLVDKAVDLKSYNRFFRNIWKAAWVLSQVRRYPHFLTFFTMMKTNSFWETVVVHPALVLRLVRKVADGTLQDMKS
jgi:anaerobic magnesium-protoporphyrin IX monomethyl ester cyclase